MSEEKETSGEVTRLLHAWRDGERSAFDHLFQLVYAELRRLAHGQRLGSGDATLVTTALVNEAYLKLVASSSSEIRDRQHFFAVAAKAMRHILVDHARSEAALKRGGGLVKTTLDEEGARARVRSDEVIALDEALGVLEKLEPRLAQIVELRFFAGLSVEESADALDLSPRTVKRDWRKARAFLHLHLGGRKDP